MTNMSTQCHATHQEIVDFLNSVSNELSLYLTLITTAPSHVTLLHTPLTVDTIPTEVGLVWFVLTDAEPDLDLEVKTLWEFAIKNPGHVQLQVGKMSEDSLTESILAFRSDNENKIKLARRIFSRLKKITKAGATVVNPEYDAEGFLREHRYTDGAKKLFESEVRLSSYIGNKYFRL